MFKEPPSAVADIILYVCQLHGNDGKHGKAGTYKSWVTQDKRNIHHRKPLGLLAFGVEELFESLRSLLYIRL
jgi:hypothetical protein